MILEKLSLQNFRNYKQREFEFSPILTLIIGPNTAGKTNILEAIYLLATGRSFRARVEREMIQHDAEIARVKCEVRNGRWEAEVGSEIAPLTSHFRGPMNIGPNHTSHITHHTSLEILLTTGSVQGRKAPYKKYLVNGVGRRKSDFVGNFYAVVFHPQDIELITDSPSRRREFLDDVLVQISREYARSLTEYEKTLRCRNKVLSQLQEQLYNRLSRDSQIYNNIQEQLEYWSKLLVKNGQVLTIERERFIDFLNDNGFVSEKELPLLRIEYNKSKISDEQLGKYAEREIAAGHTLVGPHRDDFVVKVKSYRDLSLYGSRGEQRLAVLWLKLGEVAYLEEKIGEKPVLLLDDIFSELDHGHRRLVGNIIPDYQTIITTADKHYVEDLISERRSNIKLVKLSE